MRKAEFLRAGAIIVTAVSLYACGSTEDTSHPDTRPNIVFIVADDLGYSDLGVFGSEIPTPNLDALANEGMLLTSFYASMLCSPSRAMYMSGTDNHLAGLGVMQPPTDPRQLGQPGYEAYLNFRVVSLADLLRDAGYHTYIAGKWHLGPDVENGPVARGFERSFISIDGASHLGGLSWIGPRDKHYRDGTRLVTVGEDFYSTEFYTGRMIEYIESDRNDDQPFFAYLAYTAPHWPLQAPADSIARFKSWYDDGYEALYTRRLESTISLGLLPQDFSSVPPVAGQAAWDDLSPEEQRIEARKMEIYAAMVSDLDTYVGEFIDYLESIGEFDNTFIMFISDNGPEALRRDLMSPIKEWVESCCDNSFDNLGKGDSYVMYGPNWARAGSVPFRRAKGTTFEGGTHVPAFVHYKRLVPGGTRNDGFATVMDILPTFLSLAEIEHPGTSYRGQPVLPVSGVTMLPMLTGEVSEIHNQDEYMGWELYGHRAIRQGDWKIVWDPGEGEDATWHLFNLEQDLAEQFDLGMKAPDRLQAMLRLWDEYRRENGVIEVQ